MKVNNSSISVCKNCRFFQPQSRCYGICERFGTVVNGDWPICCVAMPAFSSNH